ncbi:MAG: alkaline phosphatase family protein [Clostridia bacterium]|nr:alkaline phosphatase family protein [Clostridia bacterium]
MKKPKIIIFALDGVGAHMIREQVETGKLPGFARLMKNGVFFDDMMSVFPTISPTCWHSIYTGAVPKVHGAVCEMIHRPGDEPWKFGTSYSEKNVHADRMWDVIARNGGKSLVISALGAGADDSSMVTCVKGAAMYNITPDKTAADVDLSGVPQQYFSVRFVDDIPLYAHSVSMPQGGCKSVDNESVRFAFKRASTGRNLVDDNIDLGDWKVFDGNSDNKIAGENVFEFKTITNVPRFNPNEVEDFTWTLIVEKDGLKIGDNKTNAQNSKVIKRHQWSDVIQRKLRTETGEYAIFNFRAYCELFDPENKTYSIYITASRNLLREVVPKSKAEAIMNIPEIDSACYGDMATNADKFMESLKFQLSWREQVIKYAIENEDNDLIFTYFGTNDSVNHSEFAVYRDRVNVNVTNTKHYTSERVQSDYEHIYKIVDDHLSWVLDNATDENTIVTVCADHGAIATTDDYFPMEILKNAGLTTYKNYDFNKLNWRNEGIDWTKTKAYCVGSCYVNVNLKGREPCGIVEPEDYEKVVNEIIVALHAHGFTHAGTHPGEFAFVVPGNQAGFVGLGGECCGDVVFGLKGGDIGGYFGDVHSVQIPSAKNDVSDIRPVCIMAGKGFKKDHFLKRPTDITDIAPTLLYAAGYPQPEDATGGVVFAALDNKNK